MESCVAKAFENKLRKGFCLAFKTLELIPTFVDKCVRSASQAFSTCIFHALITCLTDKLLPPPPLRPFSFITCVSFCSGRCLIECMHTVSSSVPYDGVI